MKDLKAAITIVEIMSNLQEHETPVTYFTVEERKDGKFDVEKFNKWKDGSTLTLELTTHKTQKLADKQNAKNKEGFWGTL